MFKYTVKVPDDAPRMQLGAYVRHAFPMLPQYVIRDAFEKRDVKMDGKRSAADDQVEHGKEVTVYTKHSAVIPVLFETEHLLAIDKPSGVSCDRDSYGSMTVLDWIGESVQGREQMRLCHRLDNQTSGLLLIAKDDKTEEAVKTAFAKNQVEKKYLCIVHGTPEPKTASSIAWITKDAKRSVVSVSSKLTENAKQIITSYETVKAGKISLLCVQLHTGRTHQIRAHMAWLGYPLLGDDKYGDRERDKKLGINRLMLRSVSLRFSPEVNDPVLSALQLTAPDELDNIYAKLNNSYIKAY